MGRQMFSSRRQNNLVIQHNRIPGNEALTWSVAHSMPLSLPAYHDKLSAAGSMADDRSTGRRLGIDGDKTGTGFDSCGCAVRMLAGRMCGCGGICMVTHGMTSCIIG